MGLDEMPTPLQDHENSEDDLAGNEEQSEGDRPVFLPLLPGLSNACLHVLKIGQMQIMESMILLKL